MKNNLEKSNKLPYNCYVDNRGYVMPKSPLIHNSKEVADWVKANNDPQFNRMFNGSPKTNSSLYHEDHPWLWIGLSHSYAGLIYAYLSSDNDKHYEKFLKDSPYIKNFDNDFEGFKKYITWVSRLGMKFTKQLKNGK